ncbi:hypothetical protein F6X68_32660, partial [Micromonospora sp. AMSO12t]
PHHRVCAVAPPPRPCDSRTTVSARGRGAAARPKEIKVWLPGDGLTRVIPRSAPAAAVSATGRSTAGRLRQVGPAVASTLTAPSRRAALTLVGPT